MRFACSTATFPQNRLQIAIAKIAWAGFQAVELSLPGEDLPHAVDVRASVQANELELAAVHAGPLPAEAGEAGLETLARIGRAADFARGLDGALVVVEAPTEGTLEGLGRSLRMLDQALGALAVDVCLVNRAGTLLPGPDALQRLWDQSLPERVKIALDPGQAHLAGWDPSDLDRLPEIPRHVYLNDAREGRIVEPGVGEVDLERLGEGLRLSGFSGALSLVLENADPWAIEPLARESRAAAEAWFG